MSIRRPLQDPRWADVGGLIVEPSSGRKDVGWTTGLRPGAQFMNFLQNLFARWIEHSKDIALVSPYDWGLDVVETISAVASGEYVAPSHPVGIRCWLGVGLPTGAQPTIIIATLGPGRDLSPAAAVANIAANDVVFDTLNRQWVIVGDPGSAGADALILRSVDLSNFVGGAWSERVNPKDFRLRAIAQDDAGTLVATGDNDGSDAYTIRSVDGAAVTWAEIVLGIATTQMNGLVWNGTNFVAVGFEAGAPAIYTSPDGLAPWTSRVVDGAATGILNAVAYNGVATIAVGNDGEIHRSTDGGVSWTLVRNPGSSPDDIDIRTLAGHPENGVFLAGAERGFFLFSIDEGLTWAVHPLAPQPAQGLSADPIGADAGGFAIAAAGTGTQHLGFSVMVK